MQQIDLLEATNWLLGAEKRGQGPRSEYREMACGPVKENGRKYEVDRVPLKEEKETTLIMKFQQKKKQMNSLKHALVLKHGVWVFPLDGLYVL